MQRASNRPPGVQCLGLETHGRNLHFVLFGQQFPRRTIDFVAAREKSVKNAALIPSALQEKMSLR